MFITSDFATVAANTTQIIQYAKDAASLLLAASPRQAAAHAIGAHERACAGHDEDLTLFWAEVVRILTTPAGT